MFTLNLGNYLCGLIDCVFFHYIYVFVMNSSQFYQVSEIFRHASISSVAGLLSNLRSNGIYMFYFAVIAYDFQL
jgi:hypothetical protein